jgi:hypothetical protein
MEPARNNILFQKNERSAETVSKRAYLITPPQSSSSLLSLTWNRLKSYTEFMFIYFRSVCTARGLMKLHHKRPEREREKWKQVSLTLADTDWLQQPLIVSSLWHTHTSSSFTLRLRIITLTQCFCTWCERQIISLSVAENRELRVRALS